jgi:hypothetical protein
VKAQTERGDSSLMAAGSSSGGSGFTTDAELQGRVRMLVATKPEFAKMFNNGGLTYSDYTIDNTLSPMTRGINRITMTKSGGHFTSVLSTSIGVHASALSNDDEINNTLFHETRHSWQNYTATNSPSNTVQLNSATTMTLDQVGREVEMQKRISYTVYRTQLTERDARAFANQFFPVSGF